MATIIIKERVLLMEVEVKKVRRVFLVTNVLAMEIAVVTVVVRVLLGWGSSRHVGIPLDECGVTECGLIINGMTNTVHERG